MGALLQIIGEKDADGFYWGECGGRSGYVPCNMVSEVQVDDERVARELLKVRSIHGAMMMMKNLIKPFIFRMTKECEEAEEDGEVVTGGETFTPGPQ